MHEHAQDYDPQVEIERLRQEIQRRKHGTQFTVEHSVVAGATPGDSPLKGAKQLLERAANKNKVGRHWPSWLRRIRRNQGAVNDSVAGVLQTLLENVEGMQQKLAQVHSEIAYERVRETRDRDQLAALERGLARLKGQMEAQQKELDEFNARLKARE